MITEILICVLPKNGRCIVVNGRFSSMKSYVPVISHAHFGLASLPSPPWNYIQRAESPTQLSRGFRGGFGHRNQIQHFEYIIDQTSHIDKGK